MAKSYLSFFGNYMRKYGTCGKFNNKTSVKLNQTSFGSKKKNVPGAYFAKVDVPCVIR